jgi:hypothetical protein
VKFETRNPKLKTNSKLEDRRSAALVNYFQKMSLDISNFGFGVCFELRTSNFELL